MKRINRIRIIFVPLALVLFLGAGIFAGYMAGQKEPEQLLEEYFRCLKNKDYQGMYDLLGEESKERITQEAFLERNENIYEGIGACNFSLELLSVENTGTGKKVHYKLGMDSDAGRLEQENSALFLKEGVGKYRLSWEHSMIFPGLTEDDRIEIQTISAVRGSILDRNGDVLAGQGVASMVGLVPGKMSGDQRDLQRLAELLEMDVETMEQALGASWVQNGSFVPLKMIEKENPLDMTAYLVGEGAVEDTFQKELTAIPGVMISDTEARIYPYKEAASHLTGYVQTVTGEDLEEHPGEGYTEHSVIGRSGIEKLYEETLRGIDGYRIVMKDRNGREKQVIGARERKDGKDVTLTIDVELQRSLYEQFQNDKSCTAAINPKTGEILALVSTPSFDANDFVRGMTEKKWTELSQNPDRPMENRFREIWCPGSSFKPVIAGIGLTTGKLDPYLDFGSEGDSWQKDSSWGDYYVTTLQQYSPVTLENALLYSDNIYFAKAALLLGGDVLKQELDKLGFGERVPSEIWMTESQYSNTGDFSSEIQLADSGYGQGEILVNPLHLAAIYSAFVNNGSMIQTYLVKEDGRSPGFWKNQVFSADSVNLINQALIQVIENPAGTGYPGYIPELTLAGKTGTAEIKVTQEDTDGTELGWFAVYTPELDEDDSICIVSMAEDVKERSGSTYVVTKIRDVVKEIVQRRTAW